MTHTHSTDGTCVPDIVGAEDLSYSQLAETPPLTPTAFDLTKDCPDVATQVDQSCSAQSVVSAIEFLQKRHNGGEYQKWSRLFVFYNARKLEDKSGDFGVSLKSAIRAVQQSGACPETFWPYRWTYLDTEPTKRCYDEGKNHQVVDAYRLGTLAEMKACIASGYPFVFSFGYGGQYPETPDEPGFVRMPGKKAGDHSVMAVGYDDDRSRIFFQNSKGEGWGSDGYGSLSYEYITNGELCRDFWTIRGMENIRKHRHPPPMK